MSELCDFVPDDPSCLPEPEPVDNGDSDEPMEPMEKEDNGQKALEANMNYLIAAGTTLAFNAFWLFRYRANSYFDDIGATATSTNYYLMLDNLASYSSLLLHVVLAITQALSMAGIAVEVNMMAWYYGGMISMVVGSIYFFGVLFAHQQYHTVEESSTATTDE